MAKSLHKNVCDKVRFSKLYEKYAQSLSNILYYKYGEVLNPADKVQDAYIKLWENCAKVAPEAAKSYLYKVATNMMLNEVKHQNVVLKHQQIKPKDYTNESPEFVLRKKEFSKRYEIALSSLKEDERAAFLLSKVDGKTHKEIGELLGITKKVAVTRVRPAAMPLACGR